MDPQDVSELNPKTRIDNTLPVLQPGERVLFTIKRHPIGIIRVYVFCLLVTLLVGALAFVLAPSGDGDQKPEIGTLVLVVVGGYLDYLRTYRHQDLLGQYLDIDD